MEARREVGIGRTGFALTVAALLPLQSVMAEGQPVEEHDEARTQIAGKDAIELSRIEVTGTRIRGGATPSPVVTLGSERIREEGFADLGEVVRSLPQNFGGGQNPGVAVGATAGVGGNANQNVTGGSSLNLRGLGADATLTLINGRRMAYGGFSQAVDIGAIPVEAVERIEIVPDGASAIYGSDAVGGVGNVILKRDYDGVAAGMRYGAATAGGLDTREYSLTAGTTWAGGGVIATYRDVSADPVYARQRRYTAHMFDPNTLYPGSDLRSALISAHHAVTDSLELRLDALRTRRAQQLYQWNTGLQPYYYRVAPETTTTLFAPRLELALPAGWTLSAGGSRGRDETLQRQFQVDRATGASTTMLDECYCNQATSYEIGVEGPAFAVPAGEARLAAGVGGRSNELARRNYTAVPGQDFGGTQRSRFAYAELGVPLVGPRQVDAGHRRLELTLAARSEDDVTFGRVTTPKVGLIYGPTADLTFKTSWGKSFKAPTLLQLHQTRIGVLGSAGSYGSGYAPGATVLSLWGGNPDLKAERATQKNISLALHPAALPGLEAELTLFDIEYTDRVVQPITATYGVFDNPGLARFVDQFPTAAQLDAAVAGVDVLYNSTGRPLDPAQVVGLVRGQYANVARQEIRGVDLSGMYRFDVGPGRLTLRGSASWLDSSQQVTPAESAYDVAGTLYNPARLNGRLGVVWDRGVWSSALFSNFTSGVTSTANDDKTASFTTLDATLRYMHAGGAGSLSGLEIALSAQNVFDREPPLHVAATLDSPPYDSTNYPAIGRFLSLAVMKRW